MKKLLIFVFAFVGLAFVLVSCLPTLERQLVFWPVANEAQTPADYGLGFETLELKSEDDTKLLGWVIPFEQDAPWLLYFHGNASNISQNLRFPMLLRERLGVNVIMAEYRGFYKNEGQPSEAGLYQDARTYYNYLINSGVSTKKILIWGFSLGTGVAVELGSSFNSAALILQSPYTSVPDAARWRYNKNLPNSLLKTQFDSKSKIANVNVPLLILHGEQDEVIPFEQGKALFELANEPKEFIAFAGSHNTLNEKQGSQDLDFVLKQIEAFVLRVIKE